MNYNWGNKIKHWPTWTPYAQAIADEYEIVVPFYLTIPTKLTNTVREQVTVTAPPYQHDVLLLGAHINMGTNANGDNGQLIFLQVADQRSGIPWVAPAPVNASPATAFGGSRFQPSPILQLPEAFFLPKNVELRHDWSMQTSLATGGSITWIGVQLIQPRGGESPESVTMPDGGKLKVGGRMPWFSTMGLGTEISILGAFSYAMGPFNRVRNFTAPEDCDIEIHDVHANYFTQGGVSSSPNNILLGFSDRGQRELWQATLTPSPAVAGDVTKAYSAAPFSKPYKLPAGDRLQVSLLNLNASTINNAYLTLRGVRLCEY